MDGGGLIGDNDGGGAKWSRGAPTREVAVAEAAEAGSPTGRRRESRATKSRVASERVGETLPASRVVDSYRGEKEGNLAEILGWVGCQRT